MRILTIFTGILFIITAVWTYANQGVAFIALAFILGLVMIIGGLVSFFAFFAKCRGKIHLNYILSDGIIAILLGIIVITNRLVTDVEVPLLFGLAIIFTGTTRIITSFYIGRRRVGMRKYVFILGIIDICFGMGMMYNASVLALPNIVLVSVSFILQGINILFGGIEMPKERSFINKHAKHERREKQHKVAQKRIKQSSKDMRDAAHAVAGDKAEKVSLEQEAKEDDFDSKEARKRRRAQRAASNPEEMFAGLNLAPEKDTVEEKKIEEMIDSMDWRKTLTSFEPIRITDEEMKEALEKNKTEE